MTRFAQQFGPKELKRLAEQVVDHIDPDGTLPHDQLNADRRFFHLRPTKDGAYAGEFRLTAEAGTKLQALLGPLAKPRVNTATGPDGQLVATPDARHHGQRMHDALEDVCDRLLRADTAVPDSGGTPATVILTIDIDDLLNRTGYAVASDGTLIRTDTVAALANQAEVYTAFLTGQGEVLRLGRARRIASRGQMIAFDRPRRRLLLQAGTAESTPTGYPNGHRPGGSTDPAHPSSTPGFAVPSPPARTGASRTGVIPELYQPPHPCAAADH